MLYVNYLNYFALIFIFYVNINIKIDFKTYFKCNIITTNKLNIHTSDKTKKQIKHRQT